jgi:predicted secreted Zn-dependent protease
MLLLFAFPLASPALAKARITEKTQYYEISGKTGFELLLDMNRRGPRHGFLTKAIAQTRYETRPDGRFVHEKGCLPDQGRRGHDEDHLRLPQAAGDARQGSRPALEALSGRQRPATSRPMAASPKDFAAELDSYVRGFAVKDGASCWKALSRFERELAALYAGNKKKQAAFDLKEHRDGGPVDKSIRVLVGKR